MAGYNENEIFKELADRYIERYGEMLKEENERVNRQDAHRVTPRMDNNIKRLVKSNNKRRYATGFAALAAAVTLMLMLPAMLEFYESGFGHITGSPEGKPAPSASSAPAQAAETPSASSAPASDAEAPPAPSASTQEPPATPEILPIRFTLPDNLTVDDSKLDNGKSVYYLSNSKLDDIVLTMEISPKEDVFAGLRETRINDAVVYYKYAADFSVMAFERRDITYVLTCKHDVNTLVPLAEAII